MPVRNRTLKRCLLLSTDQAVLTELKMVLTEAGYLSDTASDRKTALGSFLQYHHHLFIIDASLLPRYPYRLLQLFKMAHRTPGVLILNKTGKDLTGFTCLPEGVIEIVKAPFGKGGFHSAIKQIDDRISTRTRKLFLRDLVILAGIAVPVVMLLFWLLLGR